MSRLLTDGELDNCLPRKKVVEWREAGRYIAKAQRDLSDKDWIEWIEGDESNAWMKDGDTATVMVCLSKDAWQARKKEVSK